MPGCQSGDYTRREGKPWSPDWAPQYSITKRPGGCNALSGVSNTKAGAGLPTPQGHVVQPGPAYGVTSSPQVITVKWSVRRRFRWPDTQSPLELMRLRAAVPVAGGFRACVPPASLPVGTRFRHHSRRAWLTARDDDGAGQFSRWLGGSNTRTGSRPRWRPSVPA